jgi:hypothetical protein
MWRISGTRGDSSILALVHVGETMLCIVCRPLDDILCIMKHNVKAHCSSKKQNGMENRMIRDSTSHSFWTPSSYPVGKLISLEQSLCWPFLEPAYLWASSMIVISSTMIKRAGSMAGGERSSHNDSRNRRASEDQNACPSSFLGESCPGRLRLLRIYIHTLAVPANVP